MTPAQVRRYFENNVAQAARQLDMSQRAIYKWLNNGVIPKRTQVWIEELTNGALKAAVRERKRKRNGGGK